MGISAYIFFGALALSAQASTVSPNCPFQFASLEAEKVFRAAPGILSFEALAVSPVTLYAAHRTGYLPERGGVWELPQTRGVVTLRGRKISEGTRKNLVRVLARHPEARIYFNRAPDQVIDGCAQMQRNSEPWLTDEIVAGYKQLAKQGIVYTSELWVDDRLVGGHLGIYSNGHIEGISKFRDMAHPLADGGGTLLAEAEYLYFSSRGITVFDVEVATIKGGVAKNHVESMPASDFSRLLDLQNAAPPSVFEGAETGAPLPVFESDFRQRFRQMRESRNYVYP